MARSSFITPVDSPNLNRIFIAFNRLVMSRDVTWIIDDESLERWRSIPKGSGLMVAVKHAHYSDEYCIYELSARIGALSYFVSVPEVFEGFLGIPRWFTRHLGGFPVERGGNNVHATRFILDTLNKGEHPIVIFAEGELYFLNDHVTPLKQGTAFFALEAAKARAKDGRPGTTFMLPVGLKYVYPGDATPVLKKSLSRLEKKLFGAAKQGEIRERIDGMMEALLARASARFGLTLAGATREERFISLAGQIVERLEKEHEKPLNGDLSDRARRLLEYFRGKDREKYETAFWAMHSLAFLPGHCYESEPSPERFMEAIRKCDRLITGNDTPAYPGHRLLYMQIQEPIKIDDYLPEYLEPKGKRGAMSRLLVDLRSSMQGAIDDLRLKARGTTARETAAAR